MLAEFHHNHAVKLRLGWHCRMDVGRGEARFCRVSVKCGFVPMSSWSLLVDFALCLQQPTPCTICRVRWSFADSASSHCDRLVLRTKVEPARYNVVQTVTEICRTLG